jgi:uncharacterized protein YdaU (DUF1376 family)
VNTPKDYTGKAPIYQQWCEKEFAFDTMHMHWIARLLFKDLLQKAWHLTTRPDLPADDTELQQILGVPPEVWAEHRAAVRAMFTIYVDKNILWHKRLRAEWATLEDKRRKRSEAGIRSGESRKNKSGIDSAAPKTITQVSSDVRSIMSAVMETCGKTPTVADVEHLLETHTADVIVDAFKDYAGNLNAPNDTDKAEFTFFRRDDGAGGDVICQVWEKQNEITKRP